MSDELVEGRCKWFNQTKGFGFLTMPGNALDVFLHANQLRKSGINHTPVEGERFKFCLNQGPKGSFATNISSAEG